jgi:deoxyribodipyrimidine photolyase-related protein
MVGRRRLLLVLGDQLDHQSALLDGADPTHDTIWMAEVDEESTKVWSHKARIVLFLSAMRHFRREMEERGFSVQYTELEAPAAKDFGSVLFDDLKKLKPNEVCVVQPGEHGVLTSLRATTEKAGVRLTVLPDRHFLCSPEEFARYAEGRKQMRMEYFYREMRRRHDVLMNGDEPCGGDWNYDHENRKAFGKHGPDDVPAGPCFAPDEITREVMRVVEQRFAKHPGKLEAFSWPVTRGEALVALDDFIAKRLPRFGDHQDAMWTDEPFLFHARLSSSLNLKLLHPREVVEAAEDAWRREPNRYPLSAVEGFIRQILGWREYVRGIYWLMMPDYLERNALDADGNLPDFYWTGDTDMQCLRHTVGQTLEFGYAHHIQRLMVTGLYAMLLGVDPKQVHEWYLAVYVDAVEWAELPNTLGMSQYADGGVMASKPYAATGKYIQRMSNYCGKCRYRPEEATGENACPFTTLYWDFLARHREALGRNQRMQMQLRNVDRMEPKKLVKIRQQAASYRARVGAAASV